MIEFYLIRAASRNASDGEVTDFGFSCMRAGRFDANEGMPPQQAHSSPSGGIGDLLRVGRCLRVLKKRHQPTARTSLVSRLPSAVYL
jgi:hypothetical protein